MISFFVPGIPKPQGSKRAYVNRHTGKASLVESAGQPLADWRGDVKRFAVDAQADIPPLEGPVEVSLGFYLNRPKSHPKTRETWPVSRPDVDKLARAVIDAMSSVCFHDDSQIVHLTAFKEWATDGTPAGCRVNVWKVGK